jgi:hypothetical protein
MNIISVYLPLLWSRDGNQVLFRQRTIQETRMRTSLHETSKYQYECETQDSSVILCSFFDLQFKLKRGP